MINYKAVSNSGKWNGRDTASCKNISNSKNLKTRDEIKTTKGARPHKQNEFRSERGQIELLIARGSRAKTLHVGLQSYQTTF